MPPRRRVPQPEREHDVPPQQDPPAFNIVDALQQAMQRIPGLMSRPAAENDRSKSFREFTKLNPPNFYGEHDPSAALRWLREVQKKFDTLAVPTEFRVGFAMYLLQDAADHWWNTIKMTHDTTTMTWEQFEELFRGQYANDDHVNEMLKQYNTIRQGSMTVN